PQPLAAWRPGGLSRRALGSLTRSPLTAAAARLGPTSGDGVRLQLVVVRKGIELRRLTQTMRERLREQPVGKPRIARQERPVQIGAHGPTDAAALPTALAVVAEACDDAPEGERLGIEARSPRVVLEARQRLTVTRLQLA